MKPDEVKQTVIIEKARRENANKPITSTNRVTDPSYVQGSIKENVPWVVYKFLPEKADDMKHPRNQQSYEDFVFGYLYYYDMVLRNGSEPHQLVFEWGKDGSYVAVIIDPPGRPTKSQYEKIQASINEYNPQEVFQIKDSDKNWLANPPVTSRIDPTPPPPPPPPDSYH